MNAKIFCTLNLFAYMGIGACSGVNMNRMDKNSMNQESDTGCSHVSCIGNSNEEPTITNEMIAKYEKEADEFDRESQKLRKSISDRMSKINKNQSVFSSGIYKGSGDFVDSSITVTEEMIAKYEEEDNEFDKKAEELRKSLHDRKE